MLACGGNTIRGTDEHPEDEHETATTRSSTSTTSRTSPSTSAVTSGPTSTTGVGPTSTTGRSDDGTSWTHGGITTSATSVGDIPTGSISDGSVSTGSGGTSESDGSVAGTGSGGTQEGTGGATTGYVGSTSQGAAGAAGAAGDDDFTELCRADCDNLARAECEGFTDEYCMYICFAFIPADCADEYAAFLECDANTDPALFTCIYDFPAIADECYDEFEASLCY